MQRAYGSSRVADFAGGQYADGAAPAELTEPVPMTLETVFDLASVTKVMATTMAIMLLVDRGDVQLEAPVAAYLPDFRGGGKDDIAVRHLLTHRSGLAQWKPTYYHAETPAQTYEFIRDLPLEWPAGAERHYSDLGFMLLGLIVERVSGRSLDAFVRDELYVPLGLGSTGFRGARASIPIEPDRFAATSHGNPFERRMVHDPDFGYAIEGDADAWSGWRDYTLEGEVNDGNAHHAFGGVAGHAGLFSSGEELDVLLTLLLEGGVIDRRRFLRAETIERFLADTGDEQALGWQLPGYAPAGAFAHTGFTGTFVLGDRDTGLALVLLTNRQNGGVDDETAYPDVGLLQRAVTRALTARR